MPAYPFHDSILSTQRPVVPPDANMAASALNNIDLSKIDTSKLDFSKVDMAAIGKMLQQGGMSWGLGEPLTESQFKAMKASQGANIIKSSDLARQKYKQKLAHLKHNRSSVYASKQIIERATNKAKAQPATQPKQDPTDSIATSATENVKVKAATEPSNQVEHTVTVASPSAAEPSNQVEQTVTVAP